MLRVVSLVFLFSLVAGHGGYEELIKKYGEKKIYESCFGTELFTKKMEEYHGWIKACEKEVGFGKKGTSVDGSAVVPTRSATSSLLQLLGQGIGQNSRILLIPVSDLNSQSRFRRDVEEENHSITKREAYFTSKKIKKLKATAMKHIEMAKCVLKKAKVLNTNNEMQWSEIEKYYTDLNIESELKQDLKEGFSKCKNFAMCMGPDDSKSHEHFPLGLKQAITYFKCERVKKVSACCKKDLRKKPEMFELGGLDGFLADYDDDEKMHKILVMNAKFGTNHHALFE